MLWNACFASFLVTDRSFPAPAQINCNTVMKLFALAALVAMCAAKAQLAAKPNLVFFMADDTGWYNVGWHNPDSE